MLILNNNAVLFALTNQPSLVSPPPSLMAELSESASQISSLCCLTQAQIGLSDQDSSVWKQPGPAEALKQMLFRLQAVEAELQRRQPSPGASTANQRLHTEEYSVLTNVSVISPQDK